MSGKILIVDDVATNRIVLKVKLAAAYYNTLQAADGATALRLAREERPDLILLDMMLPDIDGAEVCRRLKADPVTRDIPVIIITALMDPECRIRALEAGADEFLTKRRDEVILPARLRSLIRLRETSDELRLRDATPPELGFAEPAPAFDGPGVIALIAKTAGEAMRWRRDLQPWLKDELLIFDREAALVLAGRDGSTAPLPDVFMIHADLNGAGDGLRLMSDLHSRTSTRHAAMCILVEPGDRENAAMALDLGASDLLTVGTEPREMALRLSTQLRRKRQDDGLRTSLRDGMKASVTDPLTGLYNRRYALPQVARIAERSGQTGKPFAVMVLDLDRFKSVNDTWGHAVGDAVLIEVTRRLRRHLRPVDLVARIGGEEFLVVLPDAPLPLARKAAERLCREVGESPVKLPDGPEIPVSMSIGLAIGGLAEPDPVFDAQTLINMADQAMLGAKADGRNQVMIFRSAA